MNDPFREVPTMATRFVPVTDYTLTHYPAGAGPVRATIDLYDRTGKVTLVGTLELRDAPVEVADGVLRSERGERVAAIFTYDSLAAIVDTLRHEKPLMACVDTETGRILYFGTQQLEPAGEHDER
jgi:hypothetical protein